jgi:hypothetical protein
VRVCEFSLVGIYWVGHGYCCTEDQYMGRISGRRYTTVQCRPVPWRSFGRSSSAAPVSVGAARPVSMRSHRACGQAAGRAQTVKERGELSAAQHWHRECSVLESSAVRSSNTQGRRPALCCTAAPTSLTLHCLPLCTLPFKAVRSGPAEVRGVGEPACLAQ